MTAPTITTLKLSEIPMYKLDDGRFALLTYDTNAGGGVFVPPDLATNFYDSDSWSRSGNLTGYNKWGWGNAISGTGSAYGNINLADSRNVFVNSLRCGTANTGRASSYCGNETGTAGSGNIFFDGLAEWNYYFYFDIPILGNGTGDDVLVTQGFSDVWTSSTSGSNYINLVYESAVSPNWLLVTRKASALSITAMDSGVAVTSGRKSGRIRVFDNAGTITAQIYIDGVQAGTDVTTNIPNTSSNGMGLSHRIQKIGAGTGLSLNMLSHVVLTADFPAGRFI